VLFVSLAQYQRYVMVFRLSLLLFLCAVIPGFGQQKDTSMHLFRQAEQELLVIQTKAFYSKNESERIEGNKEFLAVWERIIGNPKILQYSFSNLKDISVLAPKDNKFKLITWNLQKNDGTHYYFGFLLVNNSKRIKKGFLSYETVEAYDYFKLLDRSATVKSPENYIGTPDKWFGMLYTQLIECDGYYTLIGWDGNDKLTQRKFVDVLYFRGNGEPVFGKDVFKFPRKNPRRLMFEWSQEVSMSLKYNEKRNLIIYNHLVPREREGALEGQFQFYGPDAQFDALELKKNRWVTIEDIEANSDIAPLKASKKPNPKNQKAIFEPKTKRKR